LLYHLSVIVSPCRSLVGPLVFKVGPMCYYSLWTFCEIPIVGWFTPSFHGFHRRKCKIPSLKSMISGHWRIKMWARLHTNLFILKPKSSENRSSLGISQEVYSIGQNPSCDSPSNPIIRCGPCVPGRQWHCVYLYYLPLLYTITSSTSSSMLLLARMRKAWTSSWSMLFTSLLCRVRPTREQARFSRKLDTLHLQ
jgi:hypothetical protein